jgi:hypothetical protein
LRIFASILSFFGGVFVWCWDESNIGFIK